jgi:hypothetical protein
MDEWDYFFVEILIILPANVKSARKISSVQQILSFPLLSWLDLMLGLVRPEGSQVNMERQNQPSPSRDLPADLLR